LRVAVELASQGGTEQLSSLIDLGKDHIMETTETLPAPAAPNTGQGMGVTGLVLGIVSIFSFWLYAIVPILAIIFSGISMNQTKKAGAKFNGMAIAGLVLGIIFTIPGVIIALLVISGI
jgi:hypothetical protein